MEDAENTPVAEVAPQDNETQNEQVAETETSATPPQDASQTAEDTGERLYAGKYKSIEDMEKAYTESQSKMTQLAQEKAELEKMSQSVDYTQTESTGDNPFDETTTSGVMALAKQAARAEFEEAQARQWIKTHADDLKDRAVDSLTRDLIRQGLDRDSALTEAKKELNGRETVVRKEALTEGVKEGQQLANEKNKMGAVGVTGSSDKVDPAKLSAADYAKYLNIPHSN